MKFKHLKEEWISLYESGYSFNSIAKAFSVGKGTVIRTIKNDVTIRKKDKYSDYGDEWLELYKCGWAKREIAQKYQVSANTVLKVLEKKGIVPNSTKRKFEHLLPIFIKMYNEGYSLKDISEYTNVNKQTVHNYLTREGIQLRTISAASTKYKVNDHYFDEVNSREKAYVLGVLFSKGVLIEELNTSFLQVSFHRRKYSFYKPLLQKLGDERPGYLGKDEVYRFRFHSTYLFNSLYPMLNEGKINLSDDLKTNFIGGYFSDWDFSKDYIIIKDRKPKEAIIKTFLTCVFNKNVLIADVNRMLITDMYVVQEIKKWTSFFGKR